MKKAIIFLAICISLVGCGKPRYVTVTPELRTQMLKDLREGNLVLTDQSVGTDLSYTVVRHKMYNAYNKHQWEMLTELVMQVGHPKDITYYFLGVSAEQLGFQESALKYYLESARLYQFGAPNNQCRTYNECGGLNLGNIIPARINLVKRNIQAKAQAEEAARLQAIREQEARDKAARSRQKRTQAQQVSSPSAPPQSTSTSTAPVQVAPTSTSESLPIQPFVTSVPGQAPTKPQVAPAESAKSRDEGKQRVTVQPDNRDQAPKPSSSDKPKDAEFSY